MGASRHLLAANLSAVAWLALLSTAEADADLGGGTSSESTPALSMDLPPSELDLDKLFQEKRESTNTNDAASSAAAGASNNADLTSENGSNAEPLAVNRASSATNSTGSAASSVCEQLLDAATAASRLPFRFKHVFVIGGDHEDPTSWTSRFSRPCAETLNLPEEN